MGFLDKLFGPKPAHPPAPPLNSTNAPPSDPSKDPNMIRVFDGYGRELFISKPTWKEDVLKPNLLKAWNQPDELYGMIVGALNDGFRPDVVDAAKQLYQIDPNPSRGACLWGIVLMEESRLDEAEKVFRDHIAKHGEDGVILTNLAKVYARRKKEAKAEEILWHALELDPNQENGMGWYEVIHRERGGDTASVQALQRLAALPGSWRAQLWLARAALKSRELEKAVLLYRESLSRAPRPIPPDLLMQISGDLGNAGHLPQILELVEPQFDATIHGLQVGNNLIKAHLDLGQLDAARRILDQLYALKRPDWRETLSYWDTEIAKARLDPSPPPDAPSLQMAMLTIQGPVWLRPESPAAELFPAKLGQGPLVTFIGCSAEVASDSGHIRIQMSDAPGRFSRAIPLFLAEQFEFTTTARTQTLVPWITSGSQGFVLTGGRWEDDAAATYARQTEVASDYVVIVHLWTKDEPWSVELRVVRTIDAKCLAEFRASFLSDHPELALPRLVPRFVYDFQKAAGVASSPPPSLYRFPEAAQFPDYLVRLEQLLALRCATMEGVPNTFLSGEREIIDQNIQLCLACPENVPARILLTQTLVSMKRIHPNIIPEFREKLAMLQKEKPLPEPAHSVVQRIIDEAVGT